MEPLVDVRPGIVGVAARRRWRTLVVSLLIGGLAAVALLAARGPTYTATAVVLLKPLPGNPYSPTASAGRAEELTSLETEAALVGTQTVANKAISASGGRLGPGAVDQVSVAVPSNSKILRISFAAKNPDTARIGAQAFADAYLAYRHDQAEKSANEQIDQLNRQIKVSQSAQDAASKELGNEPDGSPSVPVLQQRVQTYASEIAQLRIQLAGLEDASNAPGDVITPSAAAVTTRRPAGVADRGRGGSHCGRHRSARRALARIFRRSDPRCRRHRCTWWWAAGGDGRLDVGRHRSRQARQ